MFLINTEWLKKKTKKRNSKKEAMKVLRKIHFNREVLKLSKRGINTFGYIEFPNEAAAWAAVDMLYKKGYSVGVPSPTSPCRIHIRW